MISTPFNRMLASAAVALAFASGVDGQAQEVWMLRNPLIQGGDLNRIIYGNGIYVAAGTGGNIVSSRDAATWTVSRIGAPGAPVGPLAYGNGVFIAMLNGNEVWISTEGVAWS